MKHKITITNVHFEQWDEDHYRCTIQTMLTTFGGWMWNVSNMQTGRGYGGFAKSEEEARTSVSTKLAEMRGEVKPE